MTDRWRGPQVARAIHKLAEKGSVAGAEHLLKATLPHVPTDAGQELESSGRVSNDGTTSAVSFDTDYAVVQHERLDYEHDPGRHAKFLELTMHQERGAIAQVVADRMQL